MIKALIIDDENFARKNLSKLLSLYCHDVFVAGEANSVESAILKIETLNPELIFLDVHLAKETAFSILKMVSKISFSIIFVSAHVNYAVDAFKVNAIDYLLKPFDSDDLIMAVEKYRTLRSLKEHSSQNEISLRVHRNDSVVFIESSNVISFIAANNYTLIYSKEGQKYTAAKTLKEFEDILSADPFFIRVHRNCMINIRHLETYSKIPPYSITMKDGSEYEISRRKRAEVISILANRQLL